MGHQIEAQGQYKSKKSGNDVEYSFEYIAYDSLEDAIATLGEPEVLKRVQRMTKVDASNTAREKAKVENGDSTRKAMTEDEKAAAKAERQTNKTVLDTLKAKAKEQGMSVEEYIASLS